MARRESAALAGYSYLSQRRRRYWIHVGRGHLLAPRLLDCAAVPLGFPRTSDIDHGVIHPALHPHASASNERYQGHRRIDASHLPALGDGQTTAFTAASHLASKESTISGLALAGFLDVSESCSLHPAHRKNPACHSASPSFHPFAFYNARFSHCLHDVGIPGFEQLSFARHETRKKNEQSTAHHETRHAERRDGRDAVDRGAAKRNSPRNRARRSGLPLHTGTSLRLSLFDGNRRQG